MTFENALTVFAAVPLTTALIFLLRPFAKFVKLVDHPDDNRKRHNGVVPLTGGFSIFLSLLILFALVPDLAAPGLTQADAFWPLVGVCLTILLVTHAIDDAIQLRAVTRFGIDAALAAILCLYALVELKTLGDLFGNGELRLGRYSLVMTLFCFVAASNAFNFTDGVDCLCTGLGIIAFITLMVLIGAQGAPDSQALMYPLMVITAALVPMYLANSGVLGVRMRIFLGDSGARLIGFMAAIGLVIAAQKGFIHPVMAFFPIAVPVCDCLVLMGTRVWHGRSPLSADRLHLHHLLEDIGKTPTQIRGIIFSLAGGFSLCGLLFQLTEVADWIVSVFVVVSFWCFIFMRIQLTFAGKRRASDLARLAPSNASVSVSRETLP